MHTNIIVIHSQPLHFRTTRHTLCTNSSYISYCPNSSCWEVAEIEGRCLLLQLHAANPIDVWPSLTVSRACCTLRTCGTLAPRTSSRWNRKCRLGHRHSTNSGRFLLFVHVLNTQQPDCVSTPRVSFLAHVLSLKVRLHKHDSWSCCLTVLC